MIAVTCQGCATGRLADLRDCGRVSVGAGFGLGADMGVGALTHPSVGLVSMTQRVGFEDRQVCGQWTQIETFFPLAMVGGPLFSYYGELSDTNGTRGVACTKEGFWMNFVSDSYPERSFFNRATDFEAGATLAVLSVRVGVNPLEILDFLLGFCGFDIARDDDLKPQERVRPTHGP